MSDPYQESLAVLDQIAPDPTPTADPSLSMPVAGPSMPQASGPRGQSLAILDQLAPDAPAPMEAPPLQAPQAGPIPPTPQQSALSEYIAGLDASSKLIQERAPHAGVWLNHPDTVAKDVLGRAKDDDFKRIEQADQDLQNNVAGWVQTGQYQHDPEGFQSLLQEAAKARGEFVDAVHGAADEGSKIADEQQAIQKQKATEEVRNLRQAAKDLTSRNMSLQQGMSPEQQTKFEADWEQRIQEADPATVVALYKNAYAQREQRIERAKMDYLHRGGVMDDNSYNLKTLEWQDPEAYEAITRARDILVKKAQQIVKDDPKGGAASLAGAYADTLGNSLLGKAAQGVAGVSAGDQDMRSALEAARNAEHPYWRAAGAAVGGLAKPENLALMGATGGLSGVEATAANVAGFSALQSLEQLTAGGQPTTAKNLATNAALFGAAEAGGPIGEALAQGRGPLTGAAARFGSKVAGGVGANVGMVAAENAMAGKPNTGPEMAGAVIGGALPALIGGPEEIQRLAQKLDAAKGNVTTTRGESGPPGDSGAGMAWLDYVKSEYSRDTGESQKQKTKRLAREVTDAAAWQGFQTQNDKGGKATAVPDQSGIDPFAPDPKQLPGSDRRTMTLPGRPDAPTQPLLPEKAGTFDQRVNAVANDLAEQQASIAQQHQAPEAPQDTSAHQFHALMLQQHAQRVASYAGADFNAMTPKQLQQAAEDMGVTYDAPSTTVPRLQDARESQSLAGMSDKDLYAAAKTIIQENAIPRVKAGNRTQNIAIIKAWNDAIREEPTQGGSNVPQSPAPGATPPGEPASPQAESVRPPPQERSLVGRADGTPEVPVVEAGTHQVVEDQGSSVNHQPGNVGNVKGKPNAPETAALAEPPVPAAPSAATSAVKPPAPVSGTSETPGREGKDDSAPPAVTQEIATDIAVPLPPAPKGALTTQRMKLESMRKRLLMAQTQADKFAESAATMRDSAFKTKTLERANESREAADKLRPQFDAEVAKYKEKLGPQALSGENQHDVSTVDEGNYIEGTSREVPSSSIASAAKKMEVSAPDAPPTAPRPPGEATPDSPMFEQKRQDNAAITAGPFKGSTGKVKMKTNSGTASIEFTDKNNVTRTQIFKKGTWEEKTVGEVGAPPEASLPSASFSRGDLESKTFRELRELAGKADTRPKMIDAILAKQEDVAPERLPLSEGEHGPGAAGENDPNFIAKDYAAEESPGAIRRVITGIRDATTVDVIPKLMRAGAGPEAVQLAKARDAVLPKVRDILARVFPDSYKKPEEMAKTIDILNKDNVLSGYDDFYRRATEAMKAGKTAEANAWLKKAEDVEAHHDIAKIEEDVLAAKDDKAISANIQRWKNIVNPELNRLYNEMKRMNPDEPQPARGRHFGARINLIDERSLPDWKAALGDQLAELPPSSSANYRNPDVKRDKFDQTAKFTGQYATDAETVLGAALARRMEETAKLRFTEQLQKQGWAWEDKPGGKRPEKIKGEEVSRLPMKVPETVLDPTREDYGTTRIVERNLWVAKSLEKEIKAVLGLNDKPDIPVLQKIGNALTNLQIVGVADFVAHGKNLVGAVANAQGAGNKAMDLVRKIPGTATGKAMQEAVRVTAEIFKDTPEIRQELSRMADAGLLRGYQDHAVWQMTGKAIQHMDIAARVIMNRYFSSLVEQGRAEDTAVNRFKFVSQTGEYNRRLVGPLTRIARDLGLSPFVVAGRNFNRTGRRWLLGNPGYKATSYSEAIQARAIATAGLTLAAVSAMMLNAYTTGNPMGRPGTPIGAIDTGKTDENGRPVIHDLMQLNGMRRGARSLGLNALAEGLRQGKDRDTIVSNMVSDIMQSALHPWMGPAPAFAFKTLTGAQPDLRGRMEAQKIPGAPKFSGPQLLENARAATESQQPLLYGVLKPWLQKSGIDQTPQESWGTSIGEGTLKPIEGAIGYKSAPRATDAAEDAAQRLVGDKFGERQMTPDDARTAALKKTLLQQIKSGDMAGVKEAVSNGELSDKQAAKLIEKAGKTALEWNTKMLDHEGALLVWNKATDAEKEKLHDIVLEKVLKAQIPIAQQDAILKENDITPPADLPLTREQAALNKKEQADQDKQKELDSLRRQIIAHNQQNDAEEANALQKQWKLVASQPNQLTPQDRVRLLRLRDYVKVRNDIQKRIDEGSMSAVSGAASIKAARAKVF